MGLKRSKSDIVWTIRAFAIWVCFNQFAYGKQPWSMGKYHIFVFFIYYKVKLFCKQESLSKKPLKKHVECYPNICIRFQTYEKEC